MSIGRFTKEGRYVYWGFVKEGRYVYWEVCKGGWVLGNDRTRNLCRTRTEPNFRFLFAEPNRTFVHMI